MSLDQFYTTSECANYKIRLFNEYGSVRQDSVGQQELIFLYKQKYN